MEESSSSGRKRRRESSLAQPKDSLSALSASRVLRHYPPSCFDLGPLRQVFEEDKGEFGRREIALRLSIDKKSLSFVNQKLKDLDADILSLEQYDDIMALGCQIFLCITGRLGT